jgi:hypothetical protein
MSELVAGIQRHFKSLKRWGLPTNSGSSTAYHRTLQLLRYFADLSEAIPSESNHVDDMVLLRFRKPGYGLKGNVFERDMHVRR